MCGQTKRQSNNKDKNGRASAWKKDDAAVEVRWGEARARVVGKRQRVQSAYSDCTKIMRKRAGYAMAHTPCTHTHTPTAHIHVVGRSLEQSSGE